MWPWNGEYGRCSVTESNITCVSRSSDRVSHSPRHEKESRLCGRARPLRSYEAVLESLKRNHAATEVILSTNYASTMLPLLHHQRLFAGTPIRPKDGNDRRQSVQWRDKR